MKIVFMGTSSFAVSVLKNILENKLKLVAIFTRPDSLKGRGLEKTESPVKSFVKKKQEQIKKEDKNEIRFFQFKTLRQPKPFNILKKLNPDLIIVAAYGIIIPSKVLTLPHFGCLNIHPSLLPKYRGPSPLQAAILNQEKYTGVTIIKLNSQIDAGDIIAQKKIKMPVNIETPQLEKLLAQIGGNLLVEILPKYLTGKIKPKKQSSFKKIKPSYTKLLEKKDGLINWNQPAEKIVAQIRALKPWPGSYTFLKEPKNKNETKVDIISAEFSSSAVQKEPGLIMMNKNKFTQPIVATAKGVLILKTIRPAGKKEMDALDFTNGHPYFIGSTFQNK
jgi:methionyl-tRNA formyltransferase